MKFIVQLVLLLVGLMTWFLGGGSKPEFSKGASAETAKGDSHKVSSSAHTMVTSPLISLGHTSDVSSDIVSDVPSDEEAQVDEVFTHNCPKYNRKEYKHWIDEDRDCQNARHEALARSDRSGKDHGCKVKEGEWIDPFTGLEHKLAKNLDIDHMVPLAEAHRSGAFRWNRKKKIAFANDLEQPGALVATHRKVNRDKKAGDPSEWLPPDSTYHKTYSENWVAIKLKWGLTINPAEKKALEQILGFEHKGLSSLRVAPEQICLQSKN